MNKNTFWLFLIAILGVHLIGVFSIPLMDIDAAQYASISREMLERNSFLQIYDLGKDYLDKPPMLFWLSALSMKIFGISDWAYRLPSFIFLIVALYATFKFAKLKYNQRVAELAVLILASCQAFFLIAHDVRTDTMLMGWVALSIWLIAKWESSNAWSDFVWAMVAIAGGMMTKGPIALVVPVLAFAPQWFFEKKWTYFFKPIYLLGILIIGILLIPMSWGLYQQFDLQPGKLINNVPIQSGLRFYYWTQSFGRYTGENYYHEMSYPTFLLENMLWSFLPWIFIFIWAFVAKGLTIFKEGLFKVQTERISFFGFLLTYLVLSRSQAQLPHYIFVVFPLAAVLTAAHFAALLEQADRLHKWIKWFFGFHLFIFLILLIAMVLIIKIPFGIMDGPWGLWIFFGTIFFMIKIGPRHQNLIQRWIHMSLVLMIGLNLILNSFFYPHLLEYQWGNALVQQAKEKNWDIKKAALYKIPNSNAFHFYGQHIFPVVKDSSTLKEGQWIVADSIPTQQLLLDFPNSSILYQGSRFHVTLLTLEFLNPATRDKELTPYVLMELKK
jgi:4-amino-4-deoxy-L-arabinose transferase-like glycosyltransferase